MSRNLVPAHAADVEIAHILAGARRRNAEHDVTGALLFSEDAFAQVLEGPVAAVSTIFNIIQMDPRHAEVVVLQAGPIAEREFAEWRMAYAGRTDDARARYGALAGAGPSPGAGADVLRLLHAAVGRLGSGSARIAA
ncbi:MAG: BLUF domain-containing protein [Acetobacteraceae bacterium]|nr:BLUF domain-containing protein [Acetobacteraceae bacterium]